MRTNKSLSRHFFKAFSTSSNNHVADKNINGVFFLNIGGPNNKEEISPFLTRFFSDDTVIRIPFKLGPLIGRLRGPAKVTKQYEHIGGGSPLKMWTDKQGNEAVRLLNEEFFNETDDKFIYHPAFRYGLPLFTEALDEFLTTHKERVKRIILFSQFPQYSCSTGGNILRLALDHLDNNYDTSECEIKIIDRWYYNERYISTLARIIKEDIQKNFQEKDWDNVLILFTAHSIPVKFMAEGDQYPFEIGNTADLVSAKLGRKNPYRILWQSKVGFQDWLQPSTRDGIKKILKKNWQNLILVPLGFTSDHLETLFEIDIELQNELKHLGFNKFVRARSLNDDPEFVRGLAEIVADNIKENKYKSSNLRLRCVDCKFEVCNKLNCH